MNSPTPAKFTRPMSATLQGEAVLHVLTIISNPVRYASRYKLMEAFRAQNDGAHIEHWTVEIAYGNRPFVVTERDNPKHLQLRTADELWHKENALNLLVALVLSERPDAEYFAFVDADVTFARPDWAYETIQQLQHYDVVQMFSHAEDVGPKCQPVGNKVHRGFIWAYYNDPTFARTDARFGYTSGGHPGFAWAWRRRALDIVGGLIDVGIVGGGDRHMACGLIGTMEQSGPYREAELNQLTPSFRDSLMIWQDRAAALHRNVGYVDGLLVHHWHGRKTDRKYGNRWRIYTDNRYDPARDLRRDAQGLYALAPHRVRLRDDLRSYMRARNEDSIDLE